MSGAGLGWLVSGNSLSKADDCEHVGIECYEGEEEEERTGPEHHHQHQFLETNILPRRALVRCRND